MRPQRLTRKAAERLDLSATRLWLAVCILFAIGFNIVRALEFTVLNVRWDLALMAAWLGESERRVKLGVADAAARSARREGRRCCR